MVQLDCLSNADATMIAVNESSSDDVDRVT